MIDAAPAVGGNEIAGQDYFVPSPIWIAAHRHIKTKVPELFGHSGLTAAEVVGCPPRSRMYAMRVSNDRFGVVLLAISHKEILLGRSKVVRR
jgi:hypothetical protein